MAITARRKRTGFIRKILYTLKRSDGFPITLHKITDEVHDYETGKRTPTIITQKIARAIILPANYQRKFEYDLAFIAAGRNFTYGGFYDTALRRIIVDANDLGDFEIEIDDYYIWDTKRWQVAQVHELEYRTAFVIFAKMVEGTPRHMVEEINIETNLLLTQTVT